MKVAVITISERAYRGAYEDRSGPAIIRLLLSAFPDASVASEVVPDAPDRITEAFRHHRDADYILTTGGTGIGPKDLTPETTAHYCDRELPGISETLRSRSYNETPNAMLSRGYAGLKGTTIIVNFPGSVKAVELCTRVLIPIMEHGIQMLRGEGHK